MQNHLGVKTFADVVKFGLRARFFLPEDDGTPDHEPEPETKPWDALPYNFLVSMCRLLHDRDRYRMACVCRRWREATQNPSLWRSHVFYLYCQHELPQGLVWLAGRAQYLKHATVMCFGSFDRNRQQFLKALQRADLIDLDINGAAYWWSPFCGNATCSRVVARIVRLLKTQRQLRGFQMRQAMLPFNTGMGVLAALLVACGASLTRMGLEDFFGDNIGLNRLSRGPSMPDRFTNLICQFPHLNELTINYEYLTDGLLRWLATGGQDRQIQLNVVSWLSSEQRPVISKEAWAALAASPREIRVYLILQNIRSISEVRHTILRPEIPMHRLDLVGIAALSRDETDDMKDLLRHISHSFSHSLKGLRLWSDNYTCAEIEASVFDLLRKCTKLEYLDLHMELPCEMLAIICDMQKHRVINLRTLRLARSLTNFMEFDLFREQVRINYPILKDLGLDFHVRAESTPDHSARNEYVFIIADNAGIMDSEDEDYLRALNSANSLTNKSTDTNDNDHNNSSTVSNRSRVSRRRRSGRRNRGAGQSSGSSASNGVGRGHFEWRQYRLRRQLRSRSRRFRGIR